jgi:hypothetical protein
LGFVTTLDSSSSIAEESRAGPLPFLSLGLLLNILLSLRRSSSKTLLVLLGPASGSGVLVIRVARNVVADNNFCFALSSVIAFALVVF